MGNWLRRLRLHVDTLGYSSQQKKILAGGVLAFTLAYVGRLNLSAALPGLSAHFALTGAQSGLFQTAFAVVYAAGQLVNGVIADRVNPRRHILCGLFFSAACNLLMGALNSVWLLSVVWAANGLAQSMLWAPIVRLLALYFTGRTRVSASFLLSFTLVAGHFLAWLIAGLMNSLLSYRFSFFVPGAGLMLCVIPVWRLLPGRVSEEPLRVREQRKGSMLMLMRTGFAWLLLIGVANGFVRDGVMAWGPYVLSKGGQSFSASLIIPVLNLFGLLLGRAAFRLMHGRGRQFCLAMFALSALLSLTLAPARGLWLLAFLLGTVCALMYGVNPVLTTLFPLEYDRLGMVGLTAGLLDSAIYVGSALAGVLGGAIEGAAGYAGLYMSWAATGALGVGFCAAALRGRREPGASAEG